MADSATIARLGRQLNGTATPPYFADPALAAFLDASAQDFDAALVAGLQELRAEARKRVDYTVGPDREAASQVFKHLTTEIGEAEGRIAGRVEAVAAAATAREVSTSRPVYVSF